MRIGSFDTTERILVVAEVGNNHEGDRPAAAELVHRAADSGADAVKFQTFRTRNYVSVTDSARYEMLSGFELPFEAFEELRELAHALGLLFISTPLDLESARFLDGIVDSFKIASGDNTFFSLLAAVAGTGKPVILSAGLLDLEGTRKSASFVQRRWWERGIDPGLAVLHCVSAYPCPPEEANLAAIPVLAGALEGCTVGYSDHTIGIDACVAAAAAGARIVEKHFTLDRHTSDFRDHQLSADPDEMKRLVEAVAHVQTLLGKPEKVVQPSEAVTQTIARRSIVAARDLPAGHLLGLEDLTWVRPGGALPPGEEDRLLGKRLRRPVIFAEPILPGDLE